MPQAFLSVGPSAKYRAPDPGSEDEYRPMQESGPDGVFDTEGMPDFRGTGVD